MRYEYGQYMALIWDGTPDAYFIKGHVSDALGKETIEAEACLDAREAEALGEGEHRYGRWSMEPCEDGNGHVLRDYKDPGRGRFKVTMFGVGIFAKQSLKGTIK